MTKRMWMDKTEAELQRLNLSEGQVARIMTRIFRTSSRPYRYVSLRMVLEQIEKAGLAPNFRAIDVVRLTGQSKLAAQRSLRVLIEFGLVHRQAYGLYALDDDLDRRRQFNETYSPTRKDQVFHPPTSAMSPRL